MPVRQRMCVRETGRGGGGSERERGRERGGIYHVMILPVLTKTLTAKDRGQPRLSDVSLMPSLIRSICVSNATSMATGIGQPLAVGALHDLYIHMRI